MTVVDFEGSDGGPLPDLPPLSYFEALTLAMVNLDLDDPRTIFVGQAVEYPGTAMYNTLQYVAKNKRLEFPVAEDMQMGFCTGLSLNGFIPICIFPRINFMLLAVNQLVNHLDRLSDYSDYRPKVIIRTAIPTKEPLDPGPQHLDHGGYVPAFRSMLTNVKVVCLNLTEQIIPEYKAALERDGSTLLIEQLGKY